jgi:hypothetical protein
MTKPTGLIHRIIKRHAPTAATKRKRSTEPTPEQQALINYNEMVKAWDKGIRGKNRDE